MADKKKTTYKGSKKSKRSWRKHTDVKDVEEYLEEVRKDERTGGLIVSKPNEALYFVDTTKPVKKKKKNEVLNESDDDEEVHVSAKEKQRQRLNKQKMLDEKDELERRSQPVLTIWGQKEMKIMNSYIEPALKQPKIRPKTVGTGRSRLKALETPEAGSSYNPDFDSHQDLLLKANDREAKRQKQRELLNQKVKMVSVDELKNKSKVWLKEMSKGLLTEETNNAEETTAEEGVSEESNKCTKSKTTKTRRKEMLTKIRNEAKMEQKKRKIAMNAVYRIKSIKKEIKEKEKESIKKMLKKLESKHQMETRAKRLSKHKYVEPEIAVQLSEDLTATLREMKPDGNLLVDRFKSLQKRNIIETRKPVIPHKKLKRKFYTKRSYKTPTIKELSMKT